MVEEEVVAAAAAADDDDDDDDVAICGSNPTVRNRSQMYPLG